jgi:hypothetical protein
VDGERSSLVVASANDFSAAGGCLRVRSVLCILLEGHEITGEAACIKMAPRQEYKYLYGIGIGTGTADKALVTQKLSEG